MLCGLDTQHHMYYKDPGGFASFPLPLHLTSGCKNQQLTETIWSPPPQPWDM